MKRGKLILSTTLLATVLSFNAAADELDSKPIIDLDPYVTTGTRTERIITEAPVKTELVMQDDFQSFNITSFQEAFKLIPTARFEADCQNCGLNQIQLLGLSTDYTAILFDGAPIYSGLAKVYGADLFPSIFIDRIEVVKGGSSVLYGAEAIAGVVNLITERPDYSGMETVVSYENILGDAGQVEASFIGDYVSEAEDFAISLYGYYRDREGLDLGTDGFSELPEFENKVIGGQAYWDPSENTTLKATFQLMDEAHRGGDLLDEPEERARVAESLAHEILLFSFDWDQQLSDNLDFHFAYSMIDITRDSFYGARGDAEQVAYENAGFDGDVTDVWIAANEAAIDAQARNTWGLTENKVDYFDFQLNYTVKNHIVSGGVQYRNEELEDGSRFNDAAPKTVDEFANLGFFIQDQWTVNEQLELVPGFRVDDHDKVEDLVYSPRIAARYFLNDELTFRASWSTGFNAPGAFNEDQHIGVNQGGAIFLVNDENLVEESSETISVGFEFQPESMDEQLILHSQIHYTTLDDAFDIDDSGEVSGDENIWLRVNGGGSTIFVWENNMNWQVNDNVRIDAGASYVISKFDDPVERVTGLTTDEYIKRPDWTGHLGVTADTDFANFNALLSYTGPMIVVGEDSDVWRNSPTFYVLDLGMTKHLEDVFGETDLVLSLGIENAFDERQKDHQNNGEDRDPTYLYGPTQPRTYYMSVRLVW